VGGSSQYFDAQSLANTSESLRDASLSAFSSTVPPALPEDEPFSVADPPDLMDDVDIASPPPSAALPSQGAPSVLAVPEADFGASFQDLDISAPPQSAGQPAPRFESKAVEPAVGGAASGSTSSSTDLHVVVANPAKQGDGMSAFFTYEVMTKTSLPQYAYGQFSVTRRFRDFDWLHSQLVSKYPGTIVPPLPEKHAAQVSTMRVSGVGCSSEWVEVRRAQLQRFLQRVAAHPQLHSVSDLQTFLEASDDTLEAWKQSSQQAAKASPYYSSVLTDVKSGLLSTYSRAATMLSAEPLPSFRPQEDMACAQMSNYADAMETQVAAVHRHSKRFIERHRALASSMSGFGLSLTQLANCEADINPSLARALSSMGMSVDRMSNLYDEQGAREGAAFEEPLRDYIKMIGAAKGAIGARAAALSSLNGAARSLTAKREKLDKLKGRSSKEEAAALTAREVREAESLHSIAKQEYEQVAARVDGEMARFQREKLADFKAMLVGFVTLQLEYSKRMQSAWRDLLPHLEGISDGPPPSAGGSGGT